MKYGKENLKLVNLPKIEEEETPIRKDDELQVPDDDDSFIHS